MAKKKTTKKKVAKRIKPLSTALLGPPRDVMARLVLHGADGWNLKQCSNVADWLRQQAHFLDQMPAYAKRYTATYHKPRP